MTECKHIWNAHGTCQWCKASKDQWELAEAMKRIAELEAERDFFINDVNEELKCANTRIAELEEEVERLTKQLRSGVAVQTERTDD